MTGALQSRPYVDGRGNEYDLQDFDISGTGAGPYVRAQILVGPNGQAYTAGGALETGGNLAAVAAATGTSVDAAYIGTGSASLVSALKGVFAKLAGVLTTLGSPFQAGGSIGNTAFGAFQSGAWATGRTWLLGSGVDSVAAVQSGAWSASITNFPGTQAVSAAALPLPAGAATATGVAAVVTALGSPLQAGGSVVDSNSRAFFGTIQLVALDTTYAAGRTIEVTCTVAGSVQFMLTDGSLRTRTVYVGDQSFPYEVTRIVSAGTGATCTYFNMK